jgi:hypothetical protein
MVGYIYIYIYTERENDGEIYTTPISQIKYAKTESLCIASFIVFILCPGVLAVLEWYIRERGFAVIRQSVSDWTLQR